MAWSYDLVAWLVSLGQWAAWRRLGLQFLQPGPILELAYGTGGLCADMLRAGYQPLGIDASPYMARLASRRLRRHNFSILLGQAEAQRLPFPTNTFANIVATFPTDYIFDDQTLAEIHRVLQKPAAANNNTPGRLIIVVEGELRGLWPARLVIDWLYKVTGQHNFPAIKPLPLFEQHGFHARWETFEHEDAQARLLIAERR
jgi:ubiquinone/menaquinone biosynthesis C-methylase UbiE